jgi:glycosyltransferase involved in cell wall biosynthesis
MRWAKGVREVRMRRVVQATTTARYPGVLSQTGEDMGELTPCRCKANKGVTATAAKRIALVAHGFPTVRKAGTELYVARLARQLAARGVDLDVVYPRFDAFQPAGTIRTFLWHDIPIFEIYLPLPSDFFQLFFDRQAANHLLKLLISRNIKVAHLHHLIGFTAAALEACKDADIQSVFTAHDAWLICEQAHLLRSDGITCANGPEDLKNCARCLLQRRPGLKETMDEQRALQALEMRQVALRRIAQLAEMLIVPSRFLARLLFRQGVRTKQIKLSSLGLEEKSFRKHPGRRLSGSLRLGFFGNLFPVKGLDVLLQAFSELDQDRVSLDIFGSGTAQYIQTLQTYMADSSNIHFHGGYEESNISLLTRKVDVAVLPSRMESYGFVIRECLRAGIPVISSRVGAIPEIIRNGVNGWLVPPNDVRELAKLLRYVLDNPLAMNRLKLRRTDIETAPVEAARIHGYYEELWRKRF